MLNVQVYQSTQDIFENSFYDEIDNEIDVNIDSYSSTLITGTNPVSGWSIELVGTGFGNPEVTLQGNVSELHIYDELGDPVISFTNMNISLEGLINALEEDLVNGNPSLLDAFFSQQPINLDASASSEGAELFLDGVTADVTIIGSMFGDNIMTGSGDDDIIAGNGSDTIYTFDGDDYVNPGDNDYGDIVVLGTGQDTIEFDNGLVGYFELAHEGLSAGITAQIDGVANTGTVDRGANGTATIVNVAAPMLADGFVLGGSDHADSFEVRVADGGWMSIRGGDGADSYVINGDTGSVRLDFRHWLANSGAQVNLATGQVMNDGFGNAETIGGTGAVWEVRGTAMADMLTGSANDESFIGTGGDDTIDGGGGFDRIRFDSGSTITGLVADALTGQASGNANGDGFTLNFSSIEHIRGSNNADEMWADDSGMRLEGRSGDDTLIGGSGSDTLEGGWGNDSIRTGDNSDYDAVRAGGGNDTVDLTDVFNGFISLEHWDLNASAIFNIDGNADTAGVDKGGNGGTEIFGIAQAMQADGVAIYGTAYNDTFNATVHDNGFLSLNGYRGADQYVIGASMGFVRLDFRAEISELTGGVQINLATGQIANDGFGNAETISGPGQVNEVRGTALADMMTGSDQDESFAGMGGDDTIEGGLGFDRLRFDTGSTVFSGLNVNLGTGTATGTADGVSFTMSVSGIEWLRGSRGNDVLVGSALDDELDGRAGNDTIVGGNGDDYGDGGDGNDVMRGGVGNDDFAGDAGNDYLFGEGGFDTLFGDSGDDTLEGGSGADSLFGGDGNDLLRGGDGFDQLYGDAGDDVLLAGDSADRVYGGDGNDIIRGGINIGGSVDGLFGEAGNDTIFGDGGYDLLRGGDGDDVLDGGNQADNLYGDAGEDILMGGDGFDRLFGGTGNDQLDGGAIGDALLGEEGDDDLDGGSGDDRLIGGSGNDVMLGGEGNDLLYGNAGFDTLIGGAGDDNLRGDFNGDTFVFADMHGNDTVVDFDASSSFERLDFSGLGSINTLAEALAAATQVGGSTSIDTGNGNSIFLLGVNRADLDADDFIF